MRSPAVTSGPIASAAVLLVGSELVRAASEYALRLGAARMTVQSGRKAVPVYERTGFASSRQLLERVAD
jgi:hypothetical protein